MSAWIQCPNCALKHSQREDGICPKCKNSVLDALSGAPAFEAGGLSSGYASTDVPANTGDAAPWLNAAPNPRYAQFGRQGHTGSGMRSYLLAMLLSSVGGMIWAAVVVKTGYEIGYIAVAVGWLAGVGAKLGSRNGEDYGGVAALTAVLGIVLAKVLVITVGVSAMAAEVAEEYIPNRDLMIYTQIDEWAHEGRVPAWMARREDGPARTSPEYDPAAYLQVAAEAAAVVDAKSPEALLAVGQAAAEREFRAISFYERLKAMTSFWDALWIFLAMSTAWKVGNSEEDEA